MSALIDEKLTERIRDDFDFVMKAKRHMLAKGIRAGWRKCPRCGAKVHFRLVGPRDHLHAACDTKSCIWVME